jgi:hypothetical protein
MRYLASLAALLLPCGCGDGSDPRKLPEQAKQPTQTRQDAPGPPPEQAPGTISDDEVEGARDAASALRAYYAFIEKGDYRAAVRLRSDGRTDPARLADNFRAYESYRARVGVPGRPVRGGDWQYVRVQVMITGSHKGGGGFGSNGTVTMRRSLARTASPADRQWRVHTG